jgi:hypothetical protein
MTFIAPSPDLGKSIRKKVLKKFALAIPARLTSDFAQSHFCDESRVGRGAVSRVYPPFFFRLVFGKQVFVER